jgi:cytochrome c
MIKAGAFIFISSLLIFVLCDGKNLAAIKNIQQQNHAPVVKIISPANNSSVAANAQVHYSITVSDKEDGESKYDEINAKEVLLEVKYFNDASKLNTAFTASHGKDAPGLTAIRTSNCFNCHAFEDKNTGPSFTDINKRYKPTAANMALLQKRIKEGSTGVWGKTAMPTHPELSDAQIKNMVQWIMQNASAPGVHYYIGMEGNFNVQTLTANKNGAYLLSASYTDHGTNNMGERLEGKDAIIIKINK